MATPSEQECKKNIKLEKLSKSERRLLKKGSRTKHMLLKHEGITTCDSPTRSLFIANAGLGNGVTRDEVNKVFSNYGNIERIVMLQDKPYAFVKYYSLSDAERALESEHGGVLLGQGTSVQGVKLYISYVSEVPQPTDIMTGLPPGLTVLTEFITEEEEGNLLSCIEWENYDEDGKSLKHRRVKHYGYEFLYGVNNVDKERPLERGIPGACDELLRRLLTENYVNYLPDQLTVNQYKPGQGIPPHIDTHSAFEDGLISLSLGSQVIMDFKHPNGRHVPVLLPRRSALLMTGESRYVWTHGITPRKSDVIPELEGALSAMDGLTLSMRETRTSFTFRKVRHTPCDCKYPQYCDSQKINKTEEDIPKSKTEAVHLEEKHVHRVYEEIAGHFSSTRHTPWPKVVEFISSQPPGSLMLDVGCGNGKYLARQTNMFKIGCDRSNNLIEICQDRQFEGFVCDCLKVPIMSHTCDVVLSIAVIHHLSTEERRLSAIAEMARLLRPGGQALLYVWAMEQELHSIKSKYLKKVTQVGGNATNNDDNTNIQNIAITACSNTESCTSGKSENLQENQLLTDDRAPVVANTSDCKLVVHKNRTQFVQPDMLVPWHLKVRLEEDEESSGTVFHRYYHVFKKGELEGLCLRLSNVQILQSYYDQGNWCVVLKKL